MIHTLEIDVNIVMTMKNLDTEVLLLHRLTLKLQTKITKIKNAVPKLVYKLWYCLIQQQTA